MLKSLARSIFYGNYFYGCCTVALAIEASMQQSLPLNSYWFYLLLYCATVLFYTYAYMQENKTRYVNNRNSWYSNNRSLIKWSQLFMLAVTASLSVYFLIKYIVIDIIFLYSFFQKKHFFYFFNKISRDWYSIFQIKFIKNDHFIIFWC